MAQQINQPNCWLCPSCTVQNSGFISVCVVCNSPKPSKWQCLQCTLLNEPQNEICTICGAFKTVNSNQIQPNDQWKCSNCTLCNSYDNNICVVCGESSKNWKCSYCTYINIIIDKLCATCNKCNINKYWQCQKCTYLNDKNIKNCVGCTPQPLPQLVTNIQNINDWKCSNCTCFNIEKDKFCLVCNKCNINKYWECPKCTYVNDKNIKDCAQCSPQAQQQSVVNNILNKPQPVIHIPNIPLFVDFRDEKDNKTITVLLSKDNQIQREHFNHFGEILNELHSSSLFINSGFMQKQLDANNCHMVTTFIDVIQELIQFLKTNNKQILNEIKIAIECQTYQPKKDKLDNIEPVWNHLNDCVCGLFDTGNQFLELRDEFVFVLMDIMWKCDQIKIEEDIILKLKKNINNYSDNNNNNNNYSDNKVFKSLNKIRDILPGPVYFASLFDNITKRESEINESVRKLNTKVENNNILFKQKKDDIDSKRKQLANIKVNIDNAKKQFDAVNDGNNMELAKTYHKNVNDIVVNHNELVAIMDDDIRKINVFQDNCKITTQPFRDEIDKKKCEYTELLSKLEASRKVTGIKGDNLIQEFLEKINNLTPLSLRICSRIIQFEIMISTLSELLTRTMDNNDNNNQNISQKIEKYFIQFRLNEFIQPLNEINIFTMNDFKNVYKGKINKFKNELIPYLEDKIKRKIKMAEMRKLRRLCKAKEK